jgi:XTP/dITP diphosphohydrolase
MKIMPPPKILIGTSNREKIHELRELFAALPVRLVGLDDVGGLDEVEETGATFVENASLKASIYARQSGLFTVADDSGIEVAALGNAPGVHSARYAGLGTPFSVKIQLLLRDLDTMPDASRSARFVCAMSLADPAGAIAFETEGVCDGKLVDSPRGTGGFGYDPIFVPDGFDKTFGELDSDIRQQISHRARAAAKIMRYLQGFFDI